MEIRIGITQPRFNSTFSEYQRWINGIPISSPISIIQLQTTNSRSISFPNIHGIVFTGGADIHPSFYGVNSADPISERDLCEKEYFKHYSGKIPILGVCRGMQLINSLMGGTLYGDIVTDISEKHSIHLTHNKFSSYHKIITESSSFISDGTYLVNSRHHQAVKDVAPGLSIKGKAEDGTIEILEDPDKILVQFHPERDEICEFEISRSILIAFSKMILKNAFK